MNEHLLKNSIVIIIYLIKIPFDIIIKKLRCFI
nr:MAG TPA: hypothetical protein [Bacteriophage sp.]